MATTIPTGVPKGPASARPDPGDMADGDLWLVTDAGPNDDEYELTQAQGDSWVSKPLRSDAASVDQLGPHESGAVSWTGHQDAGGNNLSNVGSVGADEAHIGTSPKRPVSTDAVQTITVGTDAATIQEAFDMAAMLPHHAITIDIPDGDYSDEGPVLRTVTGGPLKDSGTTISVKIEGNTTTPSNVKLGSMTVDGVQGWAKVAGVRLNDASPHDDENTNFAAYNSTHVTLAHVDYNDPNGTVGVGVTAYNSNVELAINNRFDKALDRGTKIKHRGVIWEQHSSGGTPVTDQGGGGPYTAMHRAQNGIIAVDSADSNIVSRSGEPVEVAHGGMLIDMATNSIIDDSLTQRFRGLRATQPSPLVSKAFYLDDGSTNTAGWYITSDGGTNWAAV